MKLVSVVNSPHFLLRFLKKIGKRLNLRNKLVKIMFSCSGKLKFKTWWCTSVFLQHHKLIKIGPSAFPASFLLLSCAVEDCTGSWFRKLNWLKTSIVFYFLVELVFKRLSALIWLTLQLCTCPWLCEWRDGIQEREGKSGTA